MERAFTFTFHFTNYNIDKEIPVTDFSRLQYTAVKSMHDNLFRDHKNLVVISTCSLQRDTPYNEHCGQSEYVL